MKKISIVAALMVVAAGAAFASTLNVPFFADTSTNNLTGVSGFIGLKEIGGVNQTITVVYTALNSAANPTNQTVSFLLGVNQSISWTPVQTNTIEGVGSTVPTMTIVGGASPGTTTRNLFGSAQIRGTGLLSGRYQQINYNRFTEFAHVLLPMGGLH